MVRAVNSLLIGFMVLVGLWTLFRDEIAVADRKILFVGNSITFVHDVPGQVRRLAASAPGGPRYNTRMIASGGYTLSQHLAEGWAVGEIRTGVWDVVVLQDYSSAAFHASTRADTEASVARLTEEADAAGAEVVLYANWAPGQVATGARDRAVDRIAAFYDGLGTGRVALVGTVWRRAAERGIVGLYGPDGHHADVKGAFAAALAVLGTLGDVDPADTTWTPAGIGPDEARELRRLASGLTLRWRLAGD